MSKQEIFKQKQIVEIHYPVIEQSKMEKSINYFGQLFVIAISVPLGITLIVIAYKCFQFALNLKL
jgi:hypothetical protein